ncbi:hypothetical protein ADUPG1_003617, partial [Aduncisulcus paluster]
HMRNCRDTTSLTILLPSSFRAENEGATTSGSSSSSGASSFGSKFVNCNKPCFSDVFAESNRRYEVPDFMGNTKHSSLKVTLRPIGVKSVM